MTNVASLVPITPGDPRGGRKPGQVNKVTRVLKTAIILAGEQSRHSKDGSLLSYLIHIADEFPALYISLVGRLIPIQAKVKTDFARPQELTADMPLDEMVRNFELKIRDPNYHPRVIENDARDYDDGDDE